MNLIFVITKNEIRPFRSNDGKTVSAFYISGEEIYEYDECYDFAEDLKDKLLAILNMRDFSEIAVDIAYIKGEKCAAEEILKEFIPCLRVQAVEFDKIKNTAEIAMKTLCITVSSSAIEKELSNTKKSLAKAEQRIAEMERKLEEVTSKNKILNSEYQTFKKEHTVHEDKKHKIENERKKISNNRYTNERFCCYLTLAGRGSGEIDIEWYCQDEMIIRNNFDIGKCHINGSALSNTSYQDENYQLFCVGYDAVIKLLFNRSRDSKLVIIKSQKIANKEIFAVITHPEDPVEAVREWVKAKEG